MPTLFGKHFTKSELLERVGDISQVGGAQQIRLAGGVQEGVEAVEFKTGSGFDFWAVTGRGLDITIAEHNGRSLAWRSPAREVTPGLFEEPAYGWLRSFPGGLVATCGLTYAGAPCEDEGEKLGLHGRYANTPASNVWVDGAWEGDEYRMWAVGKVRESRLFGENLLLTRRVSALLGQNKFWIDDVVVNEGPYKTPHMFLYHINGGYPAVDAGSLLVSPTLRIRPRDEDAQTDKEHYYLNDAPASYYRERAYYHDMGSDADGFVYSALINKNMPDGGQFGFYVKYNINELPKFTQWKMNGTREMVVGMEPANCWVEGRAKERERGTLQFLEPGEQREYHLEFGVLTSEEEVAEFEGKVESIRGRGVKAEIL